MDIITFFKVILSLFTLWAIITNIRVNRQDKEIKRLKGYINEHIKDEIIKGTGSNDDKDNG